MKISLSTFESDIERKIVERGEEYFSCGAVSGLKEIRSGEWAASVEGTENYSVRVSLKDGSVNEHSCSCPYDLGAVCKHVVAVLFAIREGSGDGANTVDKPNLAKYPKQM